MDESKKSQFEKGKLLVCVPTLKKCLLAKEWTVEDFCRQTDITKATARRLLSGGPSRVSTLRPIAHELGVAMIDLVDPVEYEDTATDSASGGRDSEEEPSSSEWVAGRPLTSVQSTSNGLQYRVFRMKHRHQPSRFGRGKRYEFAHLSDGAQKHLKSRLVRHIEICDLLIRHEHFPICYATFPESPGDTWWVVDEWVDGSSLDEWLVELDSAVPLHTTASWAMQLANALSAMHEVSVIRRELSPKNLLVRASGDALILTDFELAKLSGNLPTVSSQWPDDPYRAPEIGVGMGEPTAAADIYSWGRIVTHLIAGELPQRGKEGDAIGVQIPKTVRELIVACTTVRPSQRPADFCEVEPVLQQWQHTLRSEGNDGA